MINAGMMTSSTPEWSTPQDLFDKLNSKYKFTLDPCSTDENAKCEKHFTIGENGLSRDWSKDVTFMNPPYGRQIYAWVKKAYETAIEGGAVVCLLPARTDTKWFHEFCTKGNIEFIKGRLKFGGQKNPAPFPSMIVIFNP